MDMSCLGMIGLFATKGLQINSKRRAASSWNPHDVSDRSKVNWDNSHGKMFEERSRILQDLALVQGSRSMPLQTFFFYEIQECPSALTSLKYFAEQMPSLAVCAVGYLLGVHLGEVSYLVGEV